MGFFSHEACDVDPSTGIVYLTEDQRGAAAAEALVLAEELGRLGFPVYLYGDLAGGRTRARTYDAAHRAASTGPRLRSAPSGRSG